MAAKSCSQTEHTCTQIHGLWGSWVKTAAAEKCEVADGEDGSSVSVCRRSADVQSLMNAVVSGSLNYESHAVSLFTALKGFVERARAPCMCAVMTLRAVKM